MKKLSHILPLILFILISTHHSFAHNIWIESKQTGAIGKEHLAKIFLGGYGENERDSTNHWFSNTASFSIWLIEPNGTKKQLTTTPAGNCFEAKFTPNQDGVYTLAISHEVAEIYGTTRYYYYASTQVKVGILTAGETNIKNATNLSIQHTKTKNAISALLQYNNEGLDQASMLVASPSGWNKNFKTNNKGIIDFELIWPGLYVLEGFYTEKTPGTLNGKEYKSTMYISTYSVDLK